MHPEEKLKLSESAEKLAFEASECFDYGGQGYRLIDVNTLTLLTSYSGCELHSIFHTTPNPTDKDVDVSVDSMKKNTIAILHHSVQSKDHCSY